MCDGYCLNTLVGKIWPDFGSNPNFGPVVLGPMVQSLKHNGSERVKLIGICFAKAHGLSLYTFLEDS